MRDRRTLAVDLGASRVGWAYFVGGELRAVGAWEIEARSRTESAGVRWLRLDAGLEAVLEVSRLQVQLAVYEEVRNHVSPRPKGGPPGPPRFNVDAAHAYGAAESRLLTWAERHGILYASVPVQAVKHAALGKGGGKGTDKVAVLAAARARWPGLQFHGFDEADAAFVGLAFLASIGEAETGFAPLPPRPPKPKKPRKGKPPTGKATGAPPLDLFSIPEG